MNETRYKVLVVHNRYRQRAGEDAVVDDEIELLKRFGHTVWLYEKDNAEINEWDGLTRGKNLFFGGARRAYLRDLDRLIEEKKPDIVHGHNLFYLLSPALYRRCQEKGAVVVQSLHNFRWLCANGLFLRRGRACEDCLEKNTAAALIHRCYRSSLVQTAGVLFWTFREKRFLWHPAYVNRFIVASRFTRSRYEKAGLPGEKIELKPHFVFSSEPRTSTLSERYVLFAGRLSEEKGILPLLRAWPEDAPWRLDVAGDGPLRRECERVVRDRRLTSVRFLGFIDSERFSEVMAQAEFLVVPSLCYENFPRIFVEAFAQGRPVMASHCGSMSELITDGENGWLVPPGDIAAWRAALERVFSHPEKLDLQQKAARRTYEENYTPEKNHERLMAIYKKARASKDAVLRPMK